MTTSTGFFQGTTERAVYDNGRNENRENKGHNDADLFPITISAAGNTRFRILSLPDT